MAHALCVTAEMVDPILPDHQIPSCTALSAPPATFKNIWQPCR